MFTELDPQNQILDDLVRQGRIEIRWGSSNVKYVQLRDRVTGRRASGRSFVNWNIALGQAAYELRQLLAVESGDRAEVSKRRDREVRGIGPYRAD